MDRKLVKLAKLRERAKETRNHENYLPHQVAHDINVVIEELYIHQIELELQLEELQQSYDALENAQQRYNKLFDNVPVSYFIMDTQGIIVNANLAASQMLGLERENLKGRVFAEFIHKDFQDIYHLCWRSTRYRQQAQACELKLQRKDGSSLPVLFNTAIPELNSEEITISVTDISPIKQSDEVLHRTLSHEKEFNQLRMSVLTIIAHEFKTPLANILSSLDLLYKHGNSLTEKKKQQLYQSIRNLVWYLNDSIQDARSTQEIENRLQFKLEVFDILAFTQQIINDMQAIGISRGKISLDTIQHERVNVIWDPNLFRRILMNLLNNAAKYSTGFVRCHLEVKETIIYLRVENEGSIISESEMQELFKEFSEGKNPEFIKGRDNGLFVVYQAVQAHAGQIYYESLNGIASFVLELPRQLANQDSQQSS